jgi:hypothetical protein
VKIRIFDLLGREVTTLANETLPAGNHSRTWDASALPSGIYFYQFSAGEAESTGKMMLAK